jgi:hypothetical protein
VEALKCLRPIVSTPPFPSACVEHTQRARRVGPLSMQLLINHPKHCISSCTCYGQNKHTCEVRIVLICFTGAHGGAFRKRNTTTGKMSDLRLSREPHHRRAKSTYRQRRAAWPLQLLPWTSGTETQRTCPTRDWDSDFCKRGGYLPWKYCVGHTLVTILRKREGWLRG